jgi:hypothetical protein
MRPARLLTCAPAIALLVIGLCGEASADRGANWLKDRGSIEWMLGIGGWRTSLGNDARSPGFEALAGGGELLVGLDVVAGVGVFAMGRVLYAGGTTYYLEGLGGTGLQLRITELVRLRLGAAAGQANLGADRAILVGGFVAGSFDLVNLGAGRLALALSVRLDVDGHVNAGGALPGQSLALALGLGLRF